MTNRSMRILATIICITAFLLTTLNISGQPVSNYDTNGNSRIDDSEFFVALDDWLKNIITDAVFFQLLDVWATNGYITHNTIENASECPDFTELIALRNGIPFRDSPNSVMSASSDSAIDIAFREAIFLASGTSMNISIASRTPGLEPQNGSLNGTLSNFSFTAIGGDRIIANATLQNGTNFPSQHEWMSFTPTWSNSVLEGSIRVEVNIDIPGCGSMGTNLTINLVRSSTSNTPQTDPGCPGGTQLMGLRDGVPFGRTSSAEFVRAQGALTKPIDIAFRHDQFLPQGTSVEFRVTSNTSGLEPRNGTLTSPFTSSSFNNQGPLEIVGRASIQNGTNVSAAFEWASFTPYWDDNVFNGEFTVIATFTAPGCFTAEISTTLYMTKSTTSSTPTHDPDCPHESNIVWMRNGLKMGSAAAPKAGSGLTSPIDIAFKDETFLPTGTSIRVELSSDTTGLEPQNGDFFHPVLGSFSTISALNILGTGSINNGVTLSPLHEWATFTPYWDSVPNSGRFEIEVTITAPNCAIVQMSTGLTMRKVTSANRSAVLVSQTPEFISFSLLSSNKFQIELRNLSGEILFEQGFAKRIVLNRSSTSRPLANGVYIYIVREQNAKGELISHSVNKLVVLR